MSQFMALSVTSLRRTIMSLLELQRTLIGTGTECIGRERLLSGSRARFLIVAIERNAVAAAKVGVVFP
jgi:hypothetical protein